MRFASTAPERTGPRFWLVLLLALAALACTHSKRRAQDTSNRELCDNYDDNAARTCHRRGRRFHYGPSPQIYCSGVPPDPEVSPPPPSRFCTCIDEVALAREQELCSSVP